MVEIYRSEGVEVDLPTMQRAELSARVVLHERVDERSKGTDPAIWREYFGRLFALTGVPEAKYFSLSDALRVAHRASHLWTYAMPGTSEVLASLRLSGYRLGVISNADGRMEGAVERAGVREHVEFVLDSGLEGIEKPEAEIFHRGCERMGLEPGECVYVGDLFPIDYVGATRAGLQAVLIDPLGVHGDRAETIGDLGGLEAWLRDGAGEA